MTLDGVIALILRFFTEFDSLLANYLILVEDRPIISVNIVSQFQSSTLCHNYSLLTLQRGLSAIAELLVNYLTKLNGHPFFICSAIL